MMDSMENLQTLPKDMTLPVPDGSDYFDMYDWYFSPVCPASKITEKGNKKTVSLRKGPKQLPGLKLSPEQHQYAVEELEQIIGARKELGVRFSRKTKKEKIPKDTVEEEASEEDDSEEDSLSTESMQEVESDRASDLGTLETEVNEIQKQERFDKSSEETKPKQSKDEEVKTRKGEALRQELTGLTHKLNKIKIGSLANIDNSLCTYPVTEGNKILYDMNLLGCSGALQNSMHWTEGGKELLFPAGAVLVSLSVDRSNEGMHDSKAQGKYVYPASNSTATQGESEIDGTRLDNGNEGRERVFSPLPQKHFAGHAGPIVGFRLSPREEFLVTVSPFSHQHGYCTCIPELRIWDYKNCKLMVVLRGFLNKEDSPEIKLFPWRSAGEWQPLEPERDVSDARPAKVGEQCVDITSDGNCVAVSGTDWRGRTVISLLDVSQLRQRYFFDKTTNIKQALKISARQMSDFPISTMKCMPGSGCQIVSAGKENVKIWRKKDEHFSGAPVVLSQYARGCEFTSITFEPPALRSIGDNSFYAKSAVQVPSSHATPNRVFAASSQGCILQINVNSRSLEAVFQLHTGPIHSIDVNEGFFISCGSDGFLRMWPHDFGTFFLEAHHDCPVTSASISPDGLKVASMTALGSVGVLDISSQRYSTLLRPHANTVQCVATRDAESNASADLVTASLDGSIRAWHTESWTPLTEFTLRDRANCCTSLAFFPVSVKFAEMSNAVVAGFESGKIRVLDVSTAAVMYEFHQHQVSVSELNFTNGDSTQKGKEDKEALKSSQRLLLVSIAKDFSLCVYDIARKFTPIRMLDLSGLFATSSLGGSECYKLSVSFSNRLSQCVVSCYVKEDNADVGNEDIDYSPVLLDGVEFTITRKLELHNRSVNSGDRRMTQQCSHQSAAMSAVSPGDSSRKPPSTQHSSVTTAQLGPMATCVAFGPKTDVIYGGMNDGRIFKWDVHTGKLLQSIQNLGMTPSRRLHNLALPPFAITSLEPSSDGKLLLTASKDGSVSIWNAALMGPTSKDALCQRFEPSLGRFGPATWCADGNYVVAAPEVLQCGLDSKALRLFEVASDQNILPASAKTWKSNRNAGGLFASGAVLRWRVNNDKQKELSAALEQTESLEEKHTSETSNTLAKPVEQQDNFKSIHAGSFSSCDVKPIAESCIDSEVSSIPEEESKPRWEETSKEETWGVLEADDEHGAEGQVSDIREDQTGSQPLVPTVKQEEACNYLNQQESSIFGKQEETSVLLKEQETSDYLLSGSGSNEANNGLWENTSTLLEYMNLGFDNSGKIPAVFLAHANEVALPKKSQILIQPLDSPQQTVIELTSDADPESAVDITSLASDDIGLWLVVGLRHHSASAYKGEIQLWSTDDMDDTGSVHAWKCSYVLLCRNTVPVHVSMDSQHCLVSALVEQVSAGGDISHSVSLWIVEGMKTGWRSDTPVLVDKPNTSCYVDSVEKKGAFSVHSDFLFKCDSRGRGVGIAVLSGIPYIVVPRSRGRIVAKRLENLCSEDDAPQRFQRIRHADLRLISVAGSEGILIALGKTNQSLFLGWLNTVDGDELDSNSWRSVSELLVAKSLKHSHRIASVFVLERHVMCIFQGGQLTVWNYVIESENVAAQRAHKNRKGRSSASGAFASKGPQKKHLNLDSNVRTAQAGVQKHFPASSSRGSSGSPLPRVNVRNSISLETSVNSIKVHDRPNAQLTRMCDSYHTQFLFMTEIGSLWRMQCTFLEPTTFSGNEGCYWSETIRPQPLHTLSVNFCYEAEHLVSLSTVRKGKLLLLSHKCAMGPSFSILPDLEKLSSSLILECSESLTQSVPIMTNCQACEGEADLLCVGLGSKLVILKSPLFELLDEYVFDEALGPITSVCIYSMRNVYICFIGHKYGDMEILRIGDSGVQECHDFPSVADSVHACSRHGKSEIARICSYSDGTSRYVAIASRNGFLSIWSTLQRKGSFYLNLLDTMALCADLRALPDGHSQLENVDVVFNTSTRLSMICTRRTSEDQVSYFLVGYSISDRRITEVSEPLPCIPCRLMDCKPEERANWVGITFRDSGSTEEQYVGWARCDDPAGFGKIHYATPPFPSNVKIMYECPLGVFPSMAVATNEGLHIFSHFPGEINDSLNYSNCEL